MILARLGDGLGLRALVTGDWDDARRTLVAALGAIGLPDDVAGARSSRRPEPEPV